MEFAFGLALYTMNFEQRIIVYIKRKCYNTCEFCKNKPDESKRCYGEEIIKV